VRGSRPASAWLKPILTRRISRSAIHKQDIEKVALSSRRASIILRVVMEFGLCRSGRTWRSARAELRRGFWGSESEMTGAGRGEKRFRSATRNP
jgi:hypothetical protein